MPLGMLVSGISRGANMLGTGGLVALRDSSGKPRYFSYDNALTYNDITSIPVNARGYSTSTGATSNLGVFAYESYLGLFDTSFTYSQAASLIGEWDRNHNLINTEKYVYSGFDYSATAYTFQTIDEARTISAHSSAAYTFGNRSNQMASDTDVVIAGALGVNGVLLTYVTRIDSALTTYSLPELSTGVAEGVGSYADGLYISFSHRSSTSSYPGPSYIYKWTSNFTRTQNYISDNRGYGAAYISYRTWCLFFGGSYTSPINAITVISNTGEIRSSSISYL